MNAFTSAIFPVEVLVTIAEFLAGDGCLGTIANLNACSSLIHQETLSVLYETVEWTGERKWWILDGGRVCSGWKYTRFLKMEARHFDPITHYIQHFDIHKQRYYRSFSKYCQVDHAPPSDPSQSSTSSSDDGRTDASQKLNMLFPNLALLIVMDNIATNHHGLHVHKGLGQVFTPIPLSALLATLGTCANHFVTSALSSVSSNPPVSSSSRHILLKELELYGKGCLTGSTITKGMGHEDCQIRLPYSCHNVLDTDFRLSTSSRTARDAEEDATLGSMVLALSTPCLVFGDTATREMNVRCDSAALDTLVGAIADIPTLPLFQIIAHIQGTVDAQAMREWILRLSRVYLSAWSQITRKAVSDTEFFHFFARSGRLDSGSPVRLSGFVGTAYRTGVYDNVTHSYKKRHTLRTNFKICHPDHWERVTEQFRQEYPETLAFAADPESIASPAACSYARTILPVIRDSMNDSDSSSQTSAGSEEAQVANAPIDIDALRPTTPVRAMDLFESPDATPSETTPSTQSAAGGAWHSLVQSPI